MLCTHLNSGELLGKQCARLSQPASCASFFCVVRSDHIWNVVKGKLEGSDREVILNANANICKEFLLGENPGPEDEDSDSSTPDEDEGDEHTSSWLLSLRARHNPWQMYGRSPLWILWGQVIRIGYCCYDEQTVRLRGQLHVIQLVIAFVGWPLPSGWSHRKYSHHFAMWKRKLRAGTAH